MAGPRDADAWWDALPAERRLQIWRWVAGGATTDTPAPNQLALIPGITPQHAEPGTTPK